MRNLGVRSSHGEYVVCVGAGAFERARSARVAAAITDRRFVTTMAWGDIPLVPVDAQEERKTLAGCEQIVCALRELGVRRDDQLLAVGGGLVQDLATFCASIYMRGLPWSYVPTTLMAMADSCIGGKSSINVGGFKNLVGNLYPPTSVFVDPAFLATLDDTELVCGLCEATKIAYCGGPEAFATYLALCRDDWSADPSGALIKHVLVTKRRFIEADEHDRGERRLLNFGHTFGHALETATDFALPHGLAVGVGMIAASELAREEDLVEHEPELVVHCVELLSRSPVLTGALKRFDRDGFERAILADKKHGHDDVHLIVPVAAGGVTEIALPKDASTLARLVGVAAAAMDRLI